MTNTYQYGKMLLRGWGKARVIFFDDEIISSSCVWKFYCLSGFYLEEELFMGFFDKIKNAAPGNSGSGGDKSVRVEFADIPQSLAAFTALPQAALQTPFDTAALFVVAMSLYSHNKDEALAMVNFLKGPQALSNHELQFIADRMAGKDYVPRSYFEGAGPGNDYSPTKPYTVTVSENPYSYQEESYAKLFIRSGGADSERPIILRLAKDGKWYLWEQHLLADIRKPESTDPWA